MFTRVLVPLDGSPDAEQTLVIAANIARNTHGSIVLGGVVPPPVVYDALYHTPSIRFQASTQSKVDASYTYLKRIAQSPLLHRLPVEIFIKCGYEAETILDIASTRQCDFIVLHSRETSGFKNGIMDSVPQQVACHAFIPVLVVRRQLSFTQPVTQIAIPLDGALDDIEHCIQEALKVGIFSSAHMTSPYVTFLYSTKGYVYSTFQACSVYELQDYLYVLIAKIEEQFEEYTFPTRHCIRIPWSLRVIDQGIHQILVKYFLQNRHNHHENEYDLLVLSLSTYDDLWRNIMSSSSKHNVADARVSFLISPPPYSAYPFIQSERCCSQNAVVYQ